jgi:GTP-binding protein
VGDRMTFVNYAPVISISALTGKGVLRIWDAIDEVYANYSQTVSTSKLNNWLEGIRQFGHTVNKGKRTLKLKYMTQTHNQPPQFTIFCNHPDLVTDNYERFLENRLRKEFDFTGTPINLKFKRRD